MNIPVLPCRKCIAGGQCCQEIIHSTLTWPVALIDFGFFFMLMHANLCPTELRLLKDEPSWRRFPQAKPALICFANEDGKAQHFAVLNDLSSSFMKLPNQGRTSTTMIFDRYR